VLSDVSSHGNHIDTLQVRSASICASVVLNNQKVLLSLVAVSSEGNIDRNNIIGTDKVLKVITVNMNTINDTIREVEKSRLDMRRHGSGAGCGYFNRNSGEGFVQARLEGKGKSSTSLSSTGLESDSLGLVLDIIKLVQAAVHHVVTMWAHALRAVEVTVLRITDAAADLVLVESTVSERLAVLGKLKVLVREFSGTEGKLVEVFASTMTRAIIGARGTLAPLSFVSIKALTFTRFTVAKTLASTFGISVTSVISRFRETKLRVVNPGELKGADSVGAVTSITSHTQSPVIITKTETTVAVTMTTARVVASS
jgi:hypothetical protein